MKLIKKLIVHRCIIVALVLAALLLFGCGYSEQDQAERLEITKNTGIG